MIVIWLMYLMHLGMEVKLAATKLDRKYAHKGDDYLEAQVQYIIANDFGKVSRGPSTGGRLPDIRMWDESGEYLGKNTQGRKCQEGASNCHSHFQTKESVAYTLFTANRDPVCIAWTAFGITHPEAVRLAEFHPGNWAYLCDISGYGKQKQIGSWFYANQVVPGVPNSAESICLWLDVYGGDFSTGFQVHWAEMNPPRRVLEDLGYYCQNNALFNFRTEREPREIQLVDIEHEISNDTQAFLDAIPVASKHGEHHKRNNTGYLPVMTHVVKSHRSEHKASVLCDRNLNARGPSFVSYVEQQFCHMPTKTLYPFCGVEKNGPCWNDKLEKVVSHGRIVKRTTDNGPTGPEDIPDLSYIEGAVIWGEEKK